MKSPDTYTAMTYNHCYGLDCTKILHTIYGHLCHLRGKIEALNGTINISNTVKLIEDLRPTFVCIQEIAGEEQRDNLSNELHDIGYNSQVFGKGQKVGISSERDRLLLASTMKSEPVSIDDIESDARFGNGGGIAAMDIPELDLRVIGAHLAFPFRLVRKRQLKLIQTLIDEAKGSVITMGDFNSTHIPKELRQLTKISSDDPTCNTHPLLRLFYNRCIDHVLGKDIEPITSATVRGKSDHRAVNVSFQLPENAT